MRNDRHVKRWALVAVTCVLVVATGAGSAPTVSKLWLGNAGNLPRFLGQTGQRSSVNAVFVGWDQGRSWGAPFANLLKQSGPIPMFHVGTKGKSGRQVITPLQISQGRGDAYLVALNQGISAYGGLVYARLMAEMNHHGNAYSAFTKSGTSRGPQYAPSAHAMAFRRFHVVLHGGTAAAINAQLKAAGLAAYAGPDLPVNPKAKLQTIWNPLGGGVPATAANAAENYFPGARWVDIVGNDIYASSKTFSSAANEALYRFARSVGLPFSLPEWGLSGADVPEFVDYICGFIKGKPAIMLAAYFEARPGSQYDLGPKPNSKKRYRACLTPLGVPAPTAPGGSTQAPPGPNQMRIVANPMAGPAPLDVEFDLFVNLPQPIVRWQVAFGDGQVAEGQGAPPASVDHSYTDDGVYQVAFTGYFGPPFTSTAIRLITQTTVKVGDDPDVLMSLVAQPRTGKAPLKVVFRPKVNLGKPPVRWEIVYGDGLTADGTGKPPSFLGHTYARKGVYRAILIVYPAPPFTGTVVRLLTYADVRVS